MFFQNLMENMNWFPRKMCDPLTNVCAHPHNSMGFNSRGLSNTLILFLDLLEASGPKTTSYIDYNLKGYNKK